jgi:hypothetical protein
MTVVWRQWVGRRQEDVVGACECTRSTTIGSSDDDSSSSVRRCPVGGLRGLR